MDFGLKRYISVNVFLIALKLFYDNTVFVVCDNSSPIDLSYDLSVICGLKGGNVIKSVPNMCTAIAVQSSSEHLSTISSIKGDLPLVLIEDRYEFAEWGDLIEQKNYYTISEDVKAYVNIIFFDKMYMQDFDGVWDRHQTTAKFDSGFNEYIIKIKSDYKDILLGMVIPFMRKDDSPKIQDKFDLFLINATMPVQCDFHKHASEMHYMTSISDISSLVSQTSSCGISTGRMILGISFEVNSVVKVVDPYYEDMSYGRVCSVKMSVHRRYCFQSIQNIFDTAIFASKQNMLGVYAQDLEDEDPEGLCKCTTPKYDSPNFPLLRIISEVHKNPEITVDSFNCMNGNFPNIIH